jgi:hypothetical protein
MDCGRGDGIWYRELMSLRRERTRRGRIRVLEPWKTDARAHVHVRTKLRQVFRDDFDAVSRNAKLPRKRSTRISASSSLHTATRLSVTSEDHSINVRGTA